MPETKTGTQGRTQTDGRWRGHVHRFAPLLLAACAAYAVYAARDLEVHGLSQPGPGMWPLIVSVVMGVTALLLVVRDIPEDYEAWSWRSVRVLGGVAVLAAYVWSLGVLGFVPSSLLFLFIWMKVLARESWRMSLLLAVVGAFALNFVFVDVFAVPFPPGLVTIESGGS
ncbi:MULTISPECIES: tripartite tricarboxylate transporter TctB family protein [unclassified Nocardioides]|uniref:tripartite tricarboxylate transporter TctB family protein n=1 Tax=unclassified Nocardioides TaxID=2615069 RepID=UPI0036132489